MYSSPQSACNPRIRSRVSDPALRSYLPRLLSTDPHQHWLSQRSYSSGYQTRLIKHITARRLPDTWVPVFIDFQDFEGESGPTARPGIPTRNIFIGMARELITAARKALPQLELPGLGPVHPITDLAFRTFLDAQS